MRARRRLINRGAAVSAGLVASLLLPVLAGCEQTADAPQTAIPVRVVTVSASPAAAGAQAAYAGVIMARTESALGFRVAGRLIARQVDVGDTVSEGAVLGTVDPVPFRLAVDAARSAVEDSRATYAQTSRELARNAPLVADQIIAPAQFDRLQSANETAKARLDEAQSRLSSAENDLSYASLRAPLDGVVTHVSAEAGQVFAAGEVAFRLAQPDTLEAIVDVPESVVASLRPDMKAAVVLLAEDGAPLPGRIREIAPAADPATRTYRVRVALEDAPRARMGMTARVRFDRPDAVPLTPETFRVPMAAVFNKDEQLAVWVIKPGDAALELRPVKVAAFEAEIATITSGLQGGDRIVTAGVHRLDAGQSIRIWDGKLP